MAECDAGVPAFCGPLSAARAWRTWLLRSTRAGYHAAAGRAGEAAWRLGVLFSFLLVRGRAAARRADRTFPEQQGSRYRIFVVLGQRELDAPMGRRQERTHSFPGAFPGRRYRIHSLFG